MDENVERTGPDTAVDPLGRAVVLSAERLASRVELLRAQVRALVPPDHGRSSHAGSSIDESDGSKTAGAVIDAARVAAEARAADAEQRLVFAEEELRARLTELARLRFRCELFEKDLDDLAAEVAVAAAGAVRAARMETERDEARERATTERQLAAQDRARAAEAEGRAIELQKELEVARGQLANDTEFNRRIEAVRESPKVLESSGTPWVELQRVASEVEAAGVEVGAGKDVLDLTEAEAVVEEQASEELVSATEDEPNSSGPARIDGGGGLRRIWGRRRPVPEPREAG
jgi:hypothetical protein